MNDAIQKLLADIVKADEDATENEGHMNALDLSCMLQRLANQAREILSATAAGRSTGYPNRSEGIAPTAATVDAGHSEMDGGYMK